MKKNKIKIGLSIGLSLITILTVVVVPTVLIVRNNIKKVDLSYQNNALKNINDAIIKNKNVWNISSLNNFLHEPSTNDLIKQQIIGIEYVETIIFDASYHIKDETYYLNPTTLTLKHGYEVGKNNIKNLKFKVSKVVNLKWMPTITAAKAAITHKIFEDKINTIEKLNAYLQTIKGKEFVKTLIKFDSWAVDLMFEAIEFDEVITINVKESSYPGYTIKTSLPSLIGITFNSIADISWIHGESTTRLTINDQISNDKIDTLDKLNLYINSEIGLTFIKSLINYEPFLVESISFQASIKENILTLIPTVVLKSHVSFGTKLENLDGIILFNSIDFKWFLNDVGAINAINLEIQTLKINTIEKLQTYIESQAGIKYLENQIDVNPIDFNWNDADVSFHVNLKDNLIILTPIIKLIKPEMKINSLPSSINLNLYLPTLKKN